MADKEYIERGSALFELETGWFPQSMEYTEAVEIARSIIKAAPAADVVEVRHAHWIEDDREATCSGCKCRTFNWAAWSFDYCPFCGAKMDGKGGSNDEVH